MKKITKIFFSILLCLILIGISKSVQANSISKISMDIYIDNNGDATVTEVWDCSTNQGTEVYHPYYNLGNSTISNLQVAEGNNKYTTISNWNTSGSLESKANKCGINKISNGVELCWGISKYGTHKYIVSYTITKFVSELTDSQMIYWTLIPYEFSNTIGNAHIKIHTDSKIADDVGVWGYGNYGGTAYVYDGYIEMQSKGSLETDEYMTILVQFPKGTFNCSNKINKEFDYYLNMAEEGSTKYEDSTSSVIPKIVMLIINLIVSLIFLIIKLAVFMLPIVIIIIIVLKSGKINPLDKILNFGQEGKDIPKDVAYFRDIPCKKDIFRAYYIGYNYGLMKNKTDLLGAIILKWLKELKIRIEQKEVGKIFKKEDTVIILNETNIENIENSKEKILFNMLLEASNDGILENKEFEKWCSSSYSKILNWFEDILLSERDKLVNEGLIITEEKTILKFLKCKEYIATSQLKQEALELAGLKKYLQEYTLIKERQAIEVVLFEEYLIYAQLMGIAKEVAKEFKEIYPEIIESSSFNSYENIIFINICADNGISQANTAKTRASNYSSGGGGSSSRGGGGGSFGGRKRRRRIPLKIQ